jgi:nucleoside 2-deoxyribosyltransferase
MTKKVCLCGSFRFYEEMIAIANYLTKQGISCYMPEPFEFRNQIQPCEFEAQWSMLRNEDKLLLSKKAESDYLKKLENADIVFVVNPSNYVGPSVLFEIGYAVAKRKLVFSLEPISEYAVMSLVEKTMTPENLAIYVLETQ